MVSCPPRRAGGTARSRRFLSPCASGCGAPRGRPATAEDYVAQRERLRKEAAEVAERQLAAAAELRAAAARLPEVRLSSAATSLLLDLIARSLATTMPGFSSGTGTDDDLGVRVILSREPGASTLIHSADGDFTVDDLLVAIVAIMAPVGTAAQHQEAVERFRREPQPRPDGYQAPAPPAAATVTSHPDEFH